MSFQWSHSTVDKPTKSNFACLITNSRHTLSRDILSCQDETFYSSPQIELTCNSWTFLQEKRPIFQHWEFIFGDFHELVGPCIEQSNMIVHILTQPRVLQPGLLNTSDLPQLHSSGVELLCEKTQHCCSSESGTTSSRWLAPDILMSDKHEWQMSHINLFRSIEGPLRRISEGLEQHQTHNWIWRAKFSTVCPYKQHLRRGWIVFTSSEVNPVCFSLELYADDILT